MKNRFTFAKLNIMLLFYSAIQKVSSSDLAFENSMKTILSEIRKDVRDLESQLKPVRDEYQKLEAVRSKTKFDFLKLKEHSEAELQKVWTELNKMKEAFRSTIVQQRDLKRDFLDAKAEFEVKKNELEASVSQLQERECFRHAKNAESCLQVPFCGFCVKDDFPSIRCDLPESLISKRCPRSKITQTNKNSKYINELMEQINITEPPNGIHMCPGQKRNISVSFANRNIPIDVYLLFDNTYHHSMKTNPNYIKEIVAAVQNISKDFTIGWGLTLDKPKFPFSTITKYSFRNVLPLTKNIESFTYSVEEVSGSYIIGGDDKNSQLEGIYQAAACKERIGWRNNSRKILLVATSKAYHVQGDGALGSITKPFDGLCALNEAGYYKNELTQDYPSEDQIVQIVESENVNVVFVHDDGAPFRQINNLALQLNGRAFLYSAFQFHGFRRNLSNIFKESFRDMTSVVDLEQSGISKDIQVNYFSNCGAEREKKRSKCKDLMNGDVTFKIEIEMLRCPSNTSNRKQLLKITPKGLPISTDIPVHLLCNCTALH